MGGNAYAEFDPEEHHKQIDHIIHCAIPSWREDLNEAVRMDLASSCIASKLLACVDISELLGRLPGVRKETHRCYLRSSVTADLATEGLYAN